VHRIIRCIKVEDDFIRRSFVRLQERIDQQLLDADRIVADLVVAGRLEFAPLQPVQLAGVQVKRYNHINALSVWERDHTVDCANPRSYALDALQRN
jgi:hypothetical protein